MSAGLAARRINKGAALAGRVPGEERFEVAADQLPVACAEIASRPGARLATMVGEDDRASSGTFRLSYVFALPPGSWITVEAPIDPEVAAFPAVTPVVPAAHWYEREVRDMLGLIPLGHP